MTRDEQLKKALEEVREVVRPALIFNDKVKPPHKLMMENAEAIGITELLWKYLESLIEHDYWEEGKHYRDTMVECIDRPFNKVRRFLEDVHDYLGVQCGLVVANKMLEERAEARESNNGPPEDQGDNGESVNS